MKRRRFDYLNLLLNIFVFAAGADEHSKKQPLVMWPLINRYGEPKELQYRAGRIDLCVNRIMSDPAVYPYFGDEESTMTTIIEFEFVI